MRSDERELFAFLQQQHFTTKRDVFSVLREQKKKAENYFFMLFRLLIREFEKQTLARSEVFH